MASKVRLFMEGTTAGVYDVAISDDRTGQSPIRLLLSTINPSYEVKRIFIDKYDDEVTTAKIDYAGANGKWYVALDNNNKPETFTATITINSLPAYFWIRASSDGITEVPGEDYSTALRVFTTQTDIFDTVRNLLAVGITRFDTSRTLVALGLRLDCDAIRETYIQEGLMADTVRVTSIQSQLRANLMRNTIEVSKFRADTLRRLNIPKKNYYFIL